MQGNTNTYTRRLGANIREELRMRFETIGGKFALVFDEMLAVCIRKYRRSRRRKNTFTWRGNPDSGRRRIYC